MPLPTFISKLKLLELNNNSHNNNNFFVFLSHSSSSGVEGQEIFVEYVVKMDLVHG